MAERSASFNRHTLPTRVWILLCGLLFAVLLLCVFCLRKPVTGAKIARVQVDGAEVLTVDLDAIREPTDIPLEVNGFSYLLRAEHGRIRVAEASCADKTCARMGWSEGGFPIVCLPRRMVIQIEQNAANDAPWNGLDGIAG